MAIKWNLYIDESGKFEDPDDVVTVAGLLIKEGVDSFSQERVRRALERAFPRVPWPVHGWVLRKVCMQAVWAYSAYKHKAQMPSSCEWDVIQLLENDERFQNACNCVRKAKDPKYDDLTYLDALIRKRDSVLWSCLFNAMIHQQEAIWRVLQSCSKISLPGSVFLVVASETIQGDSASSLRDRYLELLACLFHRTADLLLVCSGENQVWLHPLTRKIFDPRLNCFYHLNPNQINNAAVRATSPERSVKREGGEVRLIPSRPADWTNRVSSMHVLADHLAGTARYFCSRNMNLQKLTSRLHKRTGLATSLCGLPTLSSSGLAFSYLLSMRDETLCDGSVPENYVPLFEDLAVRTWAYEQAALWENQYKIWR